ncbi:sensor domain-containing diguanylate cyclase [Desulfonema ishimotonii]|uniref:diguanylate cyclase n=1 Tax=Desulfonema ishimotonii TaxID=45657 RepID=A0A401FYL6_9BACT|nr:sensor domain-containing diguanylate cyclase [Desulfonema ishimotonii]GBC62059.1 sensor domain-containing diguanylate cyclase [Desulfonema ishimotonii]
MVMKNTDRRESGSQKKENKDCGLPHSRGDIIQAQSSVFCEIGRILTSSLDPQEVFRRVMAVVLKYFSPQNWSLLMADQETGQMRFEIAMGVDEKKLSNFCLKKAEGIVGWVCMNNQPLVVPDVRKDLRFSPRVDQLLGFETRSVICIPVRNAHNQVIGAIELINKIGHGPENAVREFTEADLSILSAIGAFTGIAAENAHLHQKIRKLAIADALTGLYNRHYFYEMFQHKTERARRHGSSVCLMMMDVDGLKGINDSHGHLVGDRVLCEVADILTSSARKSDIVARLGGDEFVVLLPVSEASHGRMLSERIQQKITEWNRDAPIPGITLGLSIGIFASATATMTDMFEKADQHLYSRKALRQRGCAGHCSHPRPG